MAWPNLVRAFQVGFFETQPDECGHGGTVKCPGGEIKIIHQRAKVRRFGNQHYPRDYTLK